MKKVLSLFIFLFLVMVFVPAKIQAAVSDAYTIIANPGEDARTEININWHMDKNVTGGKIIYTKKSDTNWTDAKTLPGVCLANTVFEGISSKGPSGDFTEYPNIQRCTANLTDLEANTDYMYKVGSTNLSEVHYFKTAGADEFSFVWISDFHAYTPLPGRLSSAMNMINKAISVDPSVDFIFSTGDMAAWGGSYSFWKDMYAQTPFKNYMWASMNGNHDDMDRTSTKNSHLFFKNVNNYPLNGYEGQEGAVYFFKYNNVLFIVLNNEKMKTTEDVNKAKAWVSQVIENNSSQYIFVAEHYEWFNGVNGAYRDYGINRWMDVFDKYGVDLAMAGNNHIYLRTLPLYNKEIVAPGEGTVYMDAPSSDNERGQAMNDTVSSNADKIAFRFSEGGPTVGAILVTVNKEKVTTRLLNRNGVVLDSSEIPARRGQGTLDKEAFENSFIYTTSKLNANDGVIHCDVKGVGFVKKIEYLDDLGGLLSSNSLGNKNYINHTIKNANNLSNINVKISYQDGTTANLKLKVTNPIYDKITNLRIEDNYHLKWDYNETTDFTQSVFVDGVYFGDVNASSKGCILNKLNLGSVVELRDSKDAKAGRYLTKYTLFGDANNDGVVDSKDITVIQNHITNINKINKDLYILADVNNNGIIDMLDTTFVQLLIKKHFTNIGQVKYKVEFRDIYGYLLSSQDVLHGREALAPTPKEEAGFSFIKWDKDLSFVTSDLIVYSLYEKEDGE